MLWEEGSTYDALTGFLVPLLLTSLLADARERFKDYGARQPPINPRRTERVRLAHLGIDPAPASLQLHACL